MSLPSLRIVTILVLIGLAPLAVACGGAALSEEEAAAFAEELQREDIQADLAPVEEVQAQEEAEAAADEGMPAEAAAGEEEGGEAAEDLDVTPA